MKIFTRYMALKFLGPFCFGLGTFALLVFLGDLFDKMNKLVASDAPPGVLAQYLLLSLPYWTIRVIPMATLLAVLFAVSEFVRSGEFTAVQAAGFEAGRFFRPLLWSALGVALAGFLAQETVLPFCYRRAEFLWHERIHPEWEWDKYKDKVLPVGADQIVSFDEFRVKEGSFDRPLFDSYDAARLTRQIDARSARWDAARGLWVFYDGIDRSFGPDGAVAGNRRFTRFESELRTEPKSLRPYAKEPDEMSFLETLAYVERLRRFGRPTARARTGMHAKLAFPFTNLILAALGIPIALRLRRSSKPVAFAVALAVSFIYLTAIEMGWLLGKAGRVEPALAAWLANAGFGPLAAWMYWRES